MALTQIRELEQRDTTIGRRIHELLSIICLLVL
ncbi:unnamed protein product, partial [Rotaria sp. Silwood1]